MVTQTQCDDYRDSIYSQIVPRWIVIILVILLAGAIGACFGWTQLDSVAGASMKERMTAVEVRQENSEKLLENIDKKVDRILENMTKE